MKLNPAWIPKRSQVVKWLGVAGTFAGAGYEWFVLKDGETAKTLFLVAMGAAGWTQLAHGQSAIKTTVQAVDAKADALSDAVAVVLPPPPETDADRLKAKDREIEDLRRRLAELGDPVP